MLCRAKRNLNRFLSVRHDRGHLYQVHSRHGQLSRFHALWIPDLASHHLESTADSQHRRSCFRTLVDSLLEADPADPDEVLDSVLAAGQDDQVRPAEMLRAHDITDRDVRLMGQGQEVREVGKVRQIDDSDVDSLFPGSR